MPFDSTVSDRIDTPVAAKECVRIGPVPTWVVACPPAGDFTPARTSSFSYLLIDRQVHVEQRQTFVHLAMRLETMQAVQHRSQWQLEFEPRTQTVTVHSIRIRRGDLEFEQASLDRIHLVQRAAAPEGLMAQGSFTLSLVLEDVRAGDVLEWSATLEDRRPLPPDHHATLFSLPECVPVGRFRFSAQFNESRAMKWKSSSDGLRPTETRDNGSLLWVWMGEDFQPLEPEANTPPWYMAYPWVQVSDFANWKAVAETISKDWKEVEDDPDIAGLIRQVTEDEPELAGQAACAIRLVQDEFRCFGAEVELEGQAPAAPGTVVRRRFGDGKDLSFLLVHLLKRLGIRARPVLVNGSLRKSVADLLPTPHGFNHVLVEYELQGQTRWVDTSRQSLGGASLNPVWSNYGVGLPLDTPATGLVEPPDASLKSNLYELKETILLDTGGDWSWLSVQLTARGAQAQMFREELAADGVELLAERRLKLCQDRFQEAKRFEGLECRDDRAANEFVLAEVFEIKGFLQEHPDDRTCELGLPNDFLASLLKLPDGELRQTPFALPYPCRVSHTIEVQSGGLEPAIIPTFKVQTSFLQFTRAYRVLTSYWQLTCSLNTLADAVLPEDLEEHSQTIEEIRRQSAAHLIVGLGYAHPRKRSDFGALTPQLRHPAAKGSAGPKPPPARIITSAPKARETRTAIFDSRTTQASPPANPRPVFDPYQYATSPGQLAATQLRREKRAQRKRQQERKKIFWLVLIGLVVIGVIALLVVVSR